MRIGSRECDLAHPNSVGLRSLAVGGGNFYSNILRYASNLVGNYSREKSKVRFQQERKMVHVLNLIFLISLGLQDNWSSLVPLIF